MPTGTAQLITMIITLILAEAPVATDLIVKLKGLLAANPQAADNLQQMFADITTADQDAIASGNAWLAANGFPTVQV